MDPSRATQHQVVARNPARCSAAEIEAFVSLAKIGGEVPTRDIERGVSRAKYILWIDDDDITPCVVAALKNPLQDYRGSVFRKAKSPLRPADYPLEFGYAFTDERRRRRGHGRALMRKALELAQRQGIYATVRYDNNAMRKFLEENGFCRSGGEYASSQRDTPLVLFVGAGISVRLRASNRVR